MVMFHLKPPCFAIGMWVVAEIAQQMVLITPWLGGTGGLTLRPNGQPIAGFPEQIVLGICTNVSGVTWQHGTHGSRGSML